MRTDQANMTHSEAPVLAASLELAAAKWKVRYMMVGAIAQPCTP
jgi:hypothetical protein